MRHWQLRSRPERPEGAVRETAALVGEQPGRKGKGERLGSSKSHTRPRQATTPKRGTEKPTGEHHGGSKSRAWPPRALRGGAATAKAQGPEDTGAEQGQHTGTHTQTQQEHTPRTHTAQDTEASRAKGLGGRRVAETIELLSIMHK